MRRATRLAVVTSVLLLNICLATLYLRNIADFWQAVVLRKDAGYSKYVEPQSWHGTTKAVVIGRLATENTDWAAEFLPDWQQFVYTVNNRSEPLHTDINKGHESMVYLTYIIDNYDNLPDTIAFLHSHRRGWWSGWHTDAPDHDNVASLNAVNLAYVQRQGYVNLRCAWKPGCRLGDRRNAHVTPEIWRYMFGNETAMPEDIGAACCAQFAVSRQRVRARSREVYEHYRDWVVQTELTDAKSGRAMEFLWHVIFGKDGVDCPDPDVCYCQLYGRC